MSEDDARPDDGANGSTNPSRRTVLKRGGAIGVATAWAVPAVQSLGMSSASAIDLGSPPPGGGGEQTGSIQGVVVDAQTGDPIEGALVVVDGTGLSDTTDDEGHYSIADVPAGAATVTAGASGYQGSTQPTTVPAGGTATLNFALSAVGQAIRVVLSWGTAPTDLDLHMSGPIPGSASRFHVNWQAGEQTQGDYVALDRDDTDGEGPETTSIEVSASDSNTFVEGTYHVWIHNYSGDYLADTEFNTSNATVTLFGTTGQVGSPFTPPSSGDPTKDIWNVMRFDVDNLGNVSNVVAVQTYVDGDENTVL
jgi:uncharacterized protein YfaP (DUF2135 family)